MYECVVIGGGITGALIFRELTRRTKNVLLAEAKNDVACGATMANSAIVHAGFDPKPGTLKAFFNVRGNRLYPKLCAQLDVLLKPLPSLVVAYGNDEIPVIRELYERGVSYGVQDLSIIEKKELLTLEPNLSSCAVAALKAGSSAIVEPWGPAIAAVENALDNGASLHLSCRVDAIEKASGCFILHTDGGEIKTRTIVNAAGLHAARIHDMVDPNAFEIHGRKGHYFVLDRISAGFVSNILFPCPTEKGKGILITPVIHDKIMIGPDSEYCDGDIPFTDAESLLKVREAVSEYLSVPVPYNTIIRSFAGIRPTPSVHDFIIGECPACEGFFDAAGIESPGLASAPAIAEHLADLISKSLSLSPRSDFNPERRRQIRFSRESARRQKELADADPGYSRVICKCERITEAEIIDVIRRNCGATTVKGVKKRAGAGFGRCQAGFCMPQVIEILSKELNIPKEQVLYDDSGSYILTGRTK